MTVRDQVRIALGLGVAAVFLWLIARQVSLSDLRAAFSGTSLACVALGVLALGVGYAARIRRWQLMLEGENPDLRWRDCAGPFLSSFALNNVLPLRAGDVARLFAYQKRLGVGLGTGAAAMFVERILDMLALLAMLGIAVAVFGGQAAGLAASIGGFALVAVAGVLLAILVVPRLMSPAFRLARGLLARLGSRAERLTAEADKAHDTLHRLAAGGTMLRLAALSALAWVMEGLTFLAAALAIPGLATTAAAWLALPVGSLSTLLPSTPGYAGTFHFFVAQSMQVLGETAAMATAYAILVHAMLWVPITVAGGVALLFTAPWARSATKHPREVEA